MICDEEKGFVVVLWLTSHGQSIGSSDTFVNLDDILVSPLKEDGAMKKGTGRTAAQAAAKVLRTSTSTTVRKAAGSALTQSKAPGERTSAAAAKAASKVLTDGRTSKSAKTAAASTLAQRKK